MEERLITLVKENTRRGMKIIMLQIFQISLDYHVTVFHRI